MPTRPSNLSIALQTGVFLIVFCGAHSVMAQMEQDPFTSQCFNPGFLPTQVSGNQRFVNFIHTESQLVQGTVKYAFDGRPNDTGNSLMDYYTRPQPLVTQGVPTPRPVVFLLHGGDGSRTNPGISALAKNYARRGYVAVVPDYRTPRDPMYGNATCRDSIQFALTMQYSVADVRAAMRKLISMARVNPQIASIADTSRIFIIGQSWGGATAYNTAVSDAHEWVVPGAAPAFVTFFDSVNTALPLAQYAFYNNLDAIPVNGSCNVFDKSLLRGVACSAMPTMHLAMIDPGDQIPLFFAHGVCDNLAPYYKQTIREIYEINAYAALSTAGLPLPPPNLLPDPCTDGNYQYTVYGPEAVLKYVRNVLPPVGTVPFMHRLFRYCGGQHSIDNDVVDMERTLFFKDILDGNFDRSETFTLDIAYLLPPNFNPVGSRQFWNCVYTAQYSSWPSLLANCRTCNQSPTRFNQNSRCPWYSIDESPSSPNRYKAKPANFCTALSTAAQGVSHQDDEMLHIQPARLYDLSGRLLFTGMVHGSGTDAAVRFATQSGVGRGIYVVHTTSEIHKIGVF
jgi:dienelactone hydrolase